MRCYSLVILVGAVAVVNSNRAIPDLQMDQPVIVQPGPSIVDGRDYNRKVKDYAARAFEILTIRARTKKRKSQGRTRSFKAATCDEQYEKSLGHPYHVSERCRQRRQAFRDHQNRHLGSTQSVQVTCLADSFQHAENDLGRFTGRNSRQVVKAVSTWTRPSTDRANPDLPGVHTGQNAAYGYRSWQTVIEAWHDEVSDFLYGNGSIGVSWDTTRRSWPGGQPEWVVVSPIVQTAPTEDTTFATMLLDCGGKLCLNGGKINLNTCQCKCPDIYNGDVCQTLQCPAKDPWYCGSQWPKDYCQQFVNVPLECPYMCNICDKDSPVTPVPGVCKLQCKNGGKVDETRCTCSCPEGFAGQRCESKAYVCEGKTCMNGGQLDTSDCLCSCPLGHTGDRCETKVQACDGKTCRNRGRLNTTTCECMCTKGYGGPLCQTIVSDCPDLLCKHGGQLNRTSCRCNCPDEYTGKRCHKKKCSGVFCHNGGRVNFTDCSCSCAAGFEGTHCKQASVALTTNNACPQDCQNGGLLDPVTCLCWCPAPFTGQTCEQVECPEKDNEACGNLPEAYCVDYFLMRHMCPFKCALCAQKVCDPDKWFCSDNYIKPHLCRVVGNYCPRFCGLC